jgi:hypothetical protein
MQTGYSAKVNAFFLLDEEAAYRNNGTWQDDIIPVSEAVWLEFVSEPPEDKERGAGQDGLPAWVDVANPEKRKAEEQRAVKNSLLEEADEQIRMLKIVEEVHGLNEDEKKRLSAWKAHLADVYRMEINSKDKADWPRAPQKV